MFVFQKPGCADLLEAITAASENAKFGGGVFAFASKGGIALLLEAAHIQQMLEAGKPLHVIVGVDSITNAEALLYLQDQVTSYRGALRAEVFLHDHPNSTFHPKFSWFGSPGRLTVITGSGNLTMRGLGQVSDVAPAPGNWEAFSVQVFQGEEADKAQKEIDDWVAFYRDSGILRSLGDPAVQQRAIENGRVRMIKRTVVAHGEGQAQNVQEVPVLVDGDNFTSEEILIRELPKNRHGQADVGRRALTQFFGYAGTPIDIVLQEVTLDGELGDIEEHRLFVNQSRNYRLELGAIAPLPYDIAADDGRMILVASKLDHRSFRYTIVPATDRRYPHVSAILGAIPSPGVRSRRMRERFLSAEELKAAWSGAPDELLPIVLPVPEA